MVKTHKYTLKNNKKKTLYFSFMHDKMLVFFIIKNNIISNK